MPPRPQARPAKATPAATDEHDALSIDGHHADVVPEAGELALEGGHHAQDYTSPRSTHGRRPESVLVLLGLFPLANHYTWGLDISDTCWPTCTYVVCRHLHLHVEAIEAHQERALCRSSSAPDSRPRLHEDLLRLLPVAHGCDFATRPPIRCCMRTPY